MHTVKVVLAGMLLWAGFWLFMRATALNSWAMVACFVWAWLLLSVINLWIGVMRHGYTVREEFPILLVVFALPATLACLTHIIAKAPP